MTDPYVYEGGSVLRNLLDIKDSRTLDLVEAEQSHANMMLLYEAGFNDFSIKGIQYIHRYLFGDIYDWAGEFRVINIQKREKTLAGSSVWYSDVDQIESDLKSAWKVIGELDWKNLSLEKYVTALVNTFPPLWKVHPFREGNTRTFVMLLTFFVESHGYYLDQELLSANAGYVRDSFVLASLKDFAEPEHLTRILIDAIKTEPVEYDEPEDDSHGEITLQSRKYQTENDQPTPHEPRPDQYDPEKYRM